MIKQLIQSEKEGDSQQRLFSNTKSLIITGLVGIASSIFFLILIITKGSVIPPDGNLYKPFSFNAALGLYVINLSAFLSISGFTERGRRLWKMWMIVAALGAMAIETIQPLRGVDPRIARNHVLGDILIGAVGLSGFSIVLMILTIVLAWRLYKSNSNRKILLYSVRWSMLAIFIGFVLGAISLVALLTADFRGQYNMFIAMAAHGFAFHSLQALPFLALLLEKLPYHRSKRIMNITGTIWIAVLISLSIQNYLGHALFEGPCFYVNFILLAVYLVILVYSAIKYIKD